MSTPEPSRRPASSAGLRSLAQSLLGDEQAHEAGGTTFGDYELEEEIARGGMGIVYRAWQISLARPVAVKVMRDGSFADGRGIERFRQEAEAAAALRHPGIVPVFESGTHDGRVYYVMEWIAGPNLADATRSQPATARQAAQWLKEVAGAMAHAHALGVIHRDLKPANVLLDPEGHTRVTDFGMAQRADTAGGLTLSGQMMGTPGYMAPEIAAGDARSAGAAADVYGLGALLFHLLTGRAPFIGETHATVLRQVLEADPVSPRLLNASVPRDLETICLKALEREPGKRFAGAQEMADDLERFLQGEPVRARPVGGMERAWRWCRRKPALAASLAAVLFLSLTIALVSLLAAQRLESARAAEAEGRQTARLNLYAADVRMAGQLYEKGSLSAARRLLDGHIPAPGSNTGDLRGFDWHFLNCRLAGDQQRKAALPLAPAGDDMPVSADGRWALVVRGTQAALVELPAQRIASEWTEQRSYGFFLRYLFPCPAIDRIIVTGGDRVRLIDTQSGAVEFLGNTGAETAALSPDGHTLALGPARTPDAPPPPRVDLWDVLSRRLEKSLTLEDGSRALHWTPDGTTLLVAVMPRTIQWWRPGDSAPLRQITFSPPGEAANMPWAWFSPDASRVAIPWWDSEETLLVYDLQKDGQAAGRITGLSQGAARMAWSADGRWLAGSGSEQSILLWESGNWSAPFLLRGPMGYTGGLTFTSPETLLTVSADASARWWRVPPAPEPALYPNDMTGSHVWRPAWSPDGTLATLAGHFGINSSDRKTMGILWDVQRKVPRFEWPEIGISFSPDSRRVLTVESHRVYRERDTTTGAELRRFTLPRECGWRLPRVSPDWRWMVAWHGPGSGALYELNTGREVAVFEGGSEAAFSPDSRTLARESGRRLVVRDLASGREQETAVPCHLAIAWAPDGSELATRDDAEVHLVDASSGREKGRLSGPGARLGVMLYLPDGRTLLTTGEDGALRLWNRPTLRETITLGRMEGCAFYCAVSPDGQTILAGGARGYRFFRAVW